MPFCHRCRQRLEWRAGPEDTLPGKARHEEMAECKWPPAISEATSCSDQLGAFTAQQQYTCTKRTGRHQAAKARQTEFAAYRRRPHGFSDFLKKNSDFRLYTATIWHFGPAPSSAAIEGRGLSDRELEPSVSRTLLLVWNLNNDRPPACKIEKSVTINCEFSLPRLIMLTESHPLISGIYMCIIIIIIVSVLKWQGCMISFTGRQTVMSKLHYKSWRGGHGVAVLS